MELRTGIKLLAAATAGIGGAIALAACTGGGSRPDGPMAELTSELLAQLKPGWRSGGLNVATQAVREVRGDDGALRGSYDGSRLLQAADSHAYGTPTIGDPIQDVAGDGTATFNEVRQVVRSFDSDDSLVLERPEVVAFEAEVGVRWLPA
jgi:hypothetical protein